MSYKEFKDRLKFLRKEKKFTQKDLADKLNYGYTAISNYESGRNEPSISDINKIADIFSVSTDYLFGRTDIKNLYSNENLSEDITKVGILFSKLNKENQNTILNYINFLISQQSESNIKLLKVSEEKEIYKTRATKKEHE